MARGSSARLGALSVLFALAACSGPAPGGHGLGEPTASTHAAIIGGAKATEYAEAVLIDMYQQHQLVAACSGSVIAPQVVLTAGHCVTGERDMGLVPDEWLITAPYAQGQQSRTTTATVYDWPGTSGTVDPNYHDIGLIFLSANEPIMLSAYPQLSQSEVADGTPIVNIGRIDNGTLSNSDMFVGPPTAVYDGTASGYPYDYSSNDVIESGDSGGPDEIPSSPTHEIVSVNSGAGQGNEVLARVELLYSWIEQQIAMHGGGGFGSGSMTDAGGPPVDSGGGGTQDSGGGGGSQDSGGGGVVLDSGGGGGGSDSGGTGNPFGGGGTGGTGNPFGGGSNNGSPSGDNSGSSSSSSGCAMAAHGSSNGASMLALVGAALALTTVRRRRRV